MTEDHFPPQELTHDAPDEEGWDERYCGKCDRHIASSDGHDQTCSRHGTDWHTLPTEF